MRYTVGLIQYLLLMSMFIMGCGQIDDLMGKEDMPNSVTVKWREVETEIYEICDDGTKKLIKDQDEFSEREAKRIKNKNDGEANVPYCYADNEYINGPWNHQDFQTEEGARRYTQELEDEYKEFEDVHVDYLLKYNE